ncbi:Altered inheritance of mitochondria protein 24, mitochondrial [Ascosphaera aggregata]|nr:Altered inheritance of mitochondria protein 24, mitochondrial [Ascosphaera aggregata]
MLNYSTSSRALLRPCAALRRSHHSTQLIASIPLRFAHVRAAPEAVAERSETFVDGNYTPITEAPNSATSRGCLEVANAGAIQTVGDGNPILVSEAEFIVSLDRILIKGYTILEPESGQLSLTYWGNSRVTGRGLMALVGRGQIYLIDLQEGEKYIAHPSNVLAYTINNQLPSPYRFRSTFLNLQVPDIGQSQWLSRFKLIEEVAKSDVWKNLMLAWHTLKTWMRRTIWGDRLFLQFEGPSRILIQSRGSTVNESLTTRQVAEIADAPPGVSMQANQISSRIPSENKTEL